MWTRLTQQYEQNAAENIFVLIDRYYQYEYTEGDNMMTHISKIEGMVAQLSDLGSPIDDNQVVSKMLMTLPLQFKNFKEGWGLLPNTEKTKVNLIKKLLLSESMQAHRVTNKEKDIALLTRINTRENTFTDSAGSSGMKCSFCGLNNHVRADCRKLKRKNSMDSKSHKKSRVKCSYCHYQNHTVEDCRIRLRHEAEVAQLSKQIKNKNEDKKEKTDSTAHLVTKEESAEKSVHFQLEHAFPSMFTGGKYQESDWFADSASTEHMTGHRHFFSSFAPITHEWNVKGVGTDLQPLSVEGQGTVQIKIKVGTDVLYGVLKDVLYVPEIGVNLFSIGKATDLGIKAVFEKKSVLLYRGDSLELVGTRTAKDLYLLNFVAIPSNASGTTTIAFSAVSLNIWHKRFGHAHHDVIKKMDVEQSVIGLNLSSGNIDPEPCKGCALGKSHRQKFPKTGRRRAEKIGEIIHSDLCGPMSVASPTGSLYYVLFQDDASGFRIVYFLKRKNEVFNYFKIFVARIFTETGKRVSTFRTDNGGEYVDSEFQKYLESNGIRHETCAPYTPEQNGVSERANRTLVESALSNLFDLDLPRDLWAEAVNTAVYVKNRINGKTTSKTPFESWYLRKPDVSHFRIFGSYAYVHIPKSLRQKLDAKSQKLLFVGYSETQKAYRFFDRTTRRITVSRDAIFCEQSQTKEILSIDLPATSKTISNPPTVSDLASYSSNVSPPPILNPENSNENFHGFEPSLRRSSRAKIPKVIPSLISQSNDMTFIDPDNFFTYNDAISGSAAKQWRSAMETEIEALNRLKTWTLVPRPSGRTIVKCRWVYAVKRTVAGSIERYRARLVAKGFSQKAGIDFDETFSPVVKYDSLRIILSIAAAQDLDLFQFDVSSAFLYGDLAEEIYLEQPEGFRSPGREGDVYRLHKCLYGLKQAGRVWNAKFDGLVTAFGLTPSSVDPCVYYYRKENVVLILCLWVDDGLLVCNTAKLVSELFTYLQLHFDIKPKVVDRFVGLHITRDREHRKLYVSQPSYIASMLSTFNMQNCNPVSTPADSNSHLKLSSLSPGSSPNFPYRNAVGALIHLCVTRPDLNYAVGQVAKYSSNPDKSHVNAVKRILAYVKGTAHYGISYGTTNDSVLKSFCDADYAGDTDTRRSTTGYVLILNGGPVAWGSRRQNCVSLSTTEAEYVAACENTKQIAWFREILKDIGIIQNNATPLFCDNQGAIHLSKNPENHKRTKHIDVQYHYVRKCQAEGIISIQYIPTTKQMADIFTKALPRTTFELFRDSISVCSIPGSNPTDE